MSDVMSVVPRAEAAKTGVALVIKGLQLALADTCRLILKTHVTFKAQGYHWNLEGPLTFCIHHLIEEQYQNLFDATDALAARIRTLGQLARIALGEIMDTPILKTLNKVPSAQQMVEDLAKDHNEVALRMHRLIALADANNDPVTTGLITGRSAFHEKAAWMLRASAR